MGRSTSCERTARVEEANQATVTWRKSTRSNGSGDCVEVADGLPGVVGLRDSNDPARPAPERRSRRTDRVLRGFR
ncbi:DUF397 domain-containing protein [Micromonospora sp. D75]|nr:DUF397 domain-containing protein [Micromonospora sp. D75]